MNHRISVGAFVVNDNKILMVNHKREGRYDFWVAPGGGVQGVEALEQAVAREVKEETGLAVSVSRLLYIEEIYNPEERSVKFWYQCDCVEGELDCTAKEAVSEYIVNTKFMSRQELNDHIIFPPMLKDGFWEKIELNEVTPEFIKLRKMKFY